MFISLSFLPSSSSSYCLSSSVSSKIANSSLTFSGSFEFLMKSWAWRYSISYSLLAYANFYLIFYDSFLAFKICSCKNTLSRSCSSTCSFFSFIALWCISDMSPRNRACFLIYDNLPSSVSIFSFLICIYLWSSLLTLSLLISSWIILICSLYASMNSLSFC